MSTVVYNPKHEIFVAIYMRRSPYRVHIVMLQEHVCTLPRLTHTAHELAPNFANVYEYSFSDCVQNSTILGGFIDRAG